MGKPLIALMQPSYARSVPNKAAAKAFYRASKSLDRLELEQGTSMLPRAFNMLWCETLNARKDHAITHVAMIHDDVCPEPGWLDVLMEELEATGADMVSAVCPIKNEHGLLSTAIDITPDDPWVVRRLTMHEAFQLPETFDGGELSWNQNGRPLLTNTGLWLAKFDASWAERIAFRFHNRIVQVPSTGEWTSQDIPEDWDFARQLHAFGLRLLATRKVPLYHEHPQWHNRCAWGDWPTDLGYLEYTRRWCQGDSALSEWVFPADVPGWLTETEGLALAELARDKTVLEIGSYCGRSTICLAQSATYVHAVDTFDGRATDKPRDTMATCLENLCRYGVLFKTTLYKGTSDTVVPGIKHKVDLVFIDGDHEAGAVQRDVELALMSLNPGGVLAFHDYRSCPGEHDGRWDPGVTQAVDAMVAAGARLLDVAGTVAVVQPMVA